VRKPSWGKKTEDYESVMVYLPLWTREDLDKLVYVKAGKRNSNYAINRDRDIGRMVRLINSAWEQNGLLSQAELCVLLNRSLHTVMDYVSEYHANNPETVLPLKGYILDQGSRPIINESHQPVLQGVDPTEIAQRTGHVLIGRSYINYTTGKGIL
jgi:hypothetical protein